MKVCPKCSSIRVCRSRTRTFLEFVLRPFHYRAFRCHDCNWRGPMKTRRSAKPGPKMTFKSTLAIAAAMLLAIYVAFAIADHYSSAESTGYAENASP